MPDPIDELVQRWKHDPSAATTVALCEALRDRPSGPLVQQVGELAAQWHASDITVLVSVARMYMESNRLPEAQNILVGAGKHAPRDARVYRWLGEVLLRRGDAERASKVLERAIALGAREQAQSWLDRARAYLPIQASAGTKGVASEVARATANGRAPMDSLSEQPTSVKPLPDAKPPRSQRADVRLPKLPNSVVDTSEPPTVVRSWPGAEASGAAASAPGARLGDRPALPYPRDVLDALALSGIFEPQRAGVPAVWDKPSAMPKRKGTAALVVSMVLFLAASAGTYILFKQKRARDHVQAEALLDRVEGAFRAGRADGLAETERDLAQALRLESRSPRAALDWARERAMVGLLKSGADVAFEDAMARAKEVGVPEEKYAFARVASFLLQGDTAGAAAELPRWDAPAAGDAFYELVTAAALERAGDARARDRYAAAAKIDPDLVIAQVGLARVSALAGDIQAATRISKALRARWPDRAEPAALLALAWGCDPLRESIPVPPEAAETQRRADELPTGLKFVAHASSALEAADRHAMDQARIGVQKGLDVAESPGAAVWLGTIALSLGDVPLGRKAALLALSFSAIYEPARALAARVALYGGRLDEALKATEELSASSADVAAVRAAAAYERIDADGVGRALEALSPDARKLPVVSSLAMAEQALAGKLHLGEAQLVALATDDPPFSDLVAMDAALDSGDLPSADAIALAWGKGAESRPLQALRLARLARYDGRLDAAEALSTVAFDRATVTPRVLSERVFELVARGRSGEVGALLAHYPLVLGPLATWLSAYATASGSTTPGALEAAKGKTAALDPPLDSAPLEARVAVAAALGAMKDRKRGTDYVKALLATATLHPDLVAAALALGLHRVDHGKRRPTFE